MNRLKYILVFVLLSTTLSCGVRVGQKYKQPKLEDMPKTFLVEDSGSISDIGWSNLYSDTVLQALIDKALIYNKDMLIATARIKEMAANKRINVANLTPSIGMELAGQKEYLNYGGDADKYSPEFRANANVSWELDVWGKLRWANDAGTLAYLQTIEAKRALQLTIISQVAINYFELKALDRELEIVRQTLEARKQSLHFAKLRYEGGLTSEIPYRQSLVELARTETLVPNLEKSVSLKENDLFTLTGEFPSGRLNRGIGKYSPKMDIELPVDLPSSLLKRRPDVLQAEQKLMEANAKVGIAKADMFPSIRLTGRLGGENRELADFLKSPTWYISGILTGPLFNMGKNRAKHKAAKAVYEQEVYKYEKTVIDVFKEVNNAIISFQKAKEIQKSLEELYSSAKTYHDLALLQYVNGLVAYMDVLDSQRQLFDAEIALNKSHLSELNSIVNLYKVLGGGLEK